MARFENMIGRPSMVVAVLLAKKSSNTLLDCKSSAYPELSAHQHIHPRMNCTSMQYFSVTDSMINKIQRSWEEWDVACRS